MVVDALKILALIALMFFGMYLYAISSNLIDDARELRALKRRKKKEAKLLEERIQRDEVRAENRRLMNKRSKEIKKELKRLEEFNQNIRNKEGRSQEKVG